LGSHVDTKNKKKKTKEKIKKRKKEKWPRCGPMGLTDPRGPMGPS
jgi:hypothetical protein